MTGAAVLGGSVVVGRAVELDGMARHYVTRSVQRALLWVQPSGGQRRARRNAWSSMVSDSQRRAQRLEVERSLATANTVSAGSGGRRAVTA